MIGQQCTDQPPQLASLVGVGAELECDGVFTIDVGLDEQARRSSSLQALVPGPSRGCVLAQMEQQFGLEPGRAFWLDMSAPLGAAPQAEVVARGALPGGFPDLSQMPEGLNELPPGLEGFDLSKLKFPGR